MWTRFFVSFFLTAHIWGKRLDNCRTKCFGERWRGLEEVGWGSGLVIVNVGSELGCLLSSFWVVVVFVNLVG